MYFSYKKYTPTLSYLFINNQSNLDNFSEVQLATKTYMHLKCRMRCFDIHAQYEMIVTT